MELDVLLPGHGPVIADHRALIADRLAFHERRLERVVDALDEGATTAYEIAARVWDDGDRRDAGRPRGLGDRRPPGRPGRPRTVEEMWTPAGLPDSPRGRGRRRPGAQLIPEQQRVNRRPAPQRSVRPHGPGRGRDRRHARLGRAIVDACCAAAGADIVVSSRKPEACEEVAAEIRATGRRAVAVPCHVAHWDECDALLVEAAYADSRPGRRARQQCRHRPDCRRRQRDRSAGDKTIAVNLQAPFRLTASSGTA